MGKESINIRPLTPDDAAAFKQLRLSAVMDSPLALWPTFDEEAGQTIAQVQARIASNDHQVVLGAFDGAALVGAVGLRRNPLTQVAHKGELWGVFVAPAYRKDGLARRLLLSAVDHARGKHIVHLNLMVNTVNLRALNLYRSLGFKSFGIEPKAICVAGQFYDEEHMQLAVRPSEA